MKQNLKKFRVIRILRYLATILLIISPIIYIEMFNKMSHDISINLLLGLIFSLLFSLVPVVCIGIAIYYLSICFKANFNMYKKLINLILTYAIIIFSFSSIYYMESYFGDYTDAFLKYQYYSKFINSSMADIPEIMEEKNKIINNNYKLESKRAFRGIDDRLWSGVDYKKINGKLEEVKFTDEIISNANVDMNELNKVIKFAPNKINVYLECLYFSTITVTTVGFGDIIPNLWYSKLTVILEVILGQVLVILAIGFFFYNLGNKKPKLEEDEQDIGYYL